MNWLSNTNWSVLKTHIKVTLWQTAHPSLGSTLGPKALAGLPEDRVIQVPQGRHHHDQLNPFNPFQQPHILRPPHLSLLFWKKSSALPEARKDLGTPGLHLQKQTSALLKLRQDLEARLVLETPDARPDLGTTDCNITPGLHILLYNFRRLQLNLPEDQEGKRNQRRKHISYKDKCRNQQ